jgi:fengycin family lipopeptide synthetase E
MPASADEPTVHSIFHAQARQRPEQTAVCRGNDQLSYAELEQRSDRIARSLIRLGVRPGDFVGVLAGRSIAMVSALLGALKAGACYVPIDPSLPAARQRFIVDDTALRILLCEDAADAAAWSNGDVQAHPIGALPGTDDETAGFPTVTPESLCYVMYTSGSTGQPKGVMIAHHSVLNLVRGNDYVPLEEHDRLLLTGTIGFDQNTFEIWGALLNGLTLYLPDDENALLDARAFGALLKRHEITTVLMTTALCNRLVSQDAAVFRPIRYLLVGGDVLLPATCRTIRSFCPETRIINGYGPTESTTFATTFTVGRNSMLSIPIGKPLRNVTAYVIDDAGEIIQDGRPGELWVGGANLARGYLNRPELTRERFVEWPELGRLYRTGDLARRRADGNLEFLGRKDRQVKIGGYRIELNEVEAAIATIPGILTSVVRTWEDRGEKYIAAYYLGSAQAPDPDELRQRLLSTLPAYMVPAFFYRIDVLPLDAHGKVDQKALTNPFTEKMGDKSTVVRFLDRNELQERIRQAWRKTLGVDDVADDRDFYELGGNSIKAVHLMGILTSQGMDVALADIMHYRTVAALAGYIHGRQAQGAGHDGQKVLDELRGAFPQATLSFSTLQVQKRKRPIVVLHSDQTVAPEKLLGRLSGIAAPEWMPHSIVADAKAPRTTSASMDEHEVIEWLGLRAGTQVDVRDLQRQMKDDLRRNDERLAKERVRATYPLSPIQELQFSVKTPPSHTTLQIGTPLDLGLLKRAYAHLLADQGLLRSVPVEAEGRHSWQEHELVPERAPEPSIIDLSGFWFSDRQISELLSALIPTLHFEVHGLQHHMVVVKLNQSEYAILFLVHHVLFDRVSMEVIKRELMARYRDLATGQPIVRRQTDTFEDYVRRIDEGPQGITPRELIERFRLREFHAAKQALLAAPRTKTIPSSHSFEIAALSPRHLEGGHSLGTALSLYAKAVHAVFGVPHVPILFVHEGRRYGNRTYYDVVAEHIDFIPMLIDAEATPEATQDDVDARLAVVAKCGVNFMQLIGRPGDGWEEAGRLVDAGPANARLDICMFNYLGNQPGPGSSAEHVDAKVAINPNPLPIHTFLNCIAVSYGDGFVFRFRSSYEPHVEELRAAFAQVREAVGV